MSSSQDFSVYKTLPYNVYARAVGKWDYLQENQVYTSSQTVNISMENYDGLAMTSDPQEACALTLDFSETVLPWKWDYYNYLLTSKYCLMPVGQWYSGLMKTSADISITGTLTQNGTELSGFSSSNYFSTTGDFPTSFSTWEFGIKFTTGNLSGTQFFISDTHGGSGNVIGISGSKLLWYASNSNSYSSWNILGGVAGTSTLSANTTYWLKAVFDGSSYTCYLSTTGDFAGEETTEISVNNSTKIRGGYPVSYGAQVLNASFVTAQFNGSIDLADVYINIDGSSWWKGYAVNNSLSFKGCTYNYTDDGSAVTLNCFVVNGDESIVLTPDSSYTNGYLLGTVSVPSHTVYGYTEATEAWTQPVLSSNGTIGGDSFAVTSSTRYAASTQAYMAFDSSTISEYRSAENDNNKYLEFYNPTPIAVTRIDVVNWTDYFVRDWEFQYSDDGSSWGILTSGTSDAGNSAQWGFDVTSSGTHKYYRLRVLSASGSSFSVSHIGITAHTVTATWTAE